MLAKRLSSYGSFAPLHPAYGRGCRYGRRGSVIPRSEGCASFRHGVCAFFLVLGALWLWAFPAAAQTAPPTAVERGFTPIIVTTQNASVPIGRHTIVRADPENNITATRLRQTQGSILSGRLSDNNIIYLGHKGVSQWLAFKILNSGEGQKWILDLGRRMDGRIGYSGAVTVYEMPLAMPGAETRPDFYLKELRPALDKGLYSVTLPANTQKLIILNIQPVAGVPATLPLKLHAEENVLKSLQGRAAANAVYATTLFGLSFFFVLCAFLRQVRAGIPFAVYFAFALLAYFIYDNFGPRESMSFFKGAMLILIFIFCSLSIWTTMRFLRLGMTGYTEKYILYALGGFNALAVFLSFFLPAQEDGTLHASILYGMPLATLIVLALMSFIHTLSSKVKGQSFTAGWVVMVAGTLIMALSARDIIHIGAFGYNSFWYALPLQGVLMAIAFLRNIDTFQPYVAETIGHEQLNLSRLKQAKEEADHSRLLQVIEKERAAIAELRRKEAIQLAEMRKAKEAADEANRAKSAFLAVVSHEIRTPMTGIMGMVRLLLDSNISRQQKDYAVTIQESGDAMLALLNDILDFEKIQHGKMEIEDISFDLHRVLHGVITLMSGHAEQKNVGLVSQIDENLPRFVKGDPTRLRQILLNLMGNALKFTQSGSVTLYARNMDDRENAQGGTGTYMIYFGVQDTGIGIPAEAQKNLFTPFAQADSSISRKFGGTGLGLAISKGLVEAMGSSINISSKENEGSTFFFTLSMAQGLAVAPDAGGGVRAGHNSMPKASSTLPPTPREDDGQKHRVTPEPGAYYILVTDDNAINRKVIHGFLEPDGHAITLCSTAEEALQHLEKNPVDVILMDIELPGMAGNEAARFIRTMPDLTKKTVPIIALTGHVDDDYRRRYLGDGMNGLVPKPIDPDILKTAIAQVMNTEDTAETSQLSSQPLPSPEIVGGSLQPLEPRNETAEPDNTAAVIFDSNMLQSLKNSIGDESLKQLLDELILKNDEIIGALREAYKEGDIAALYARGHELKGMAGNFGLLELSALAGLIEQKTKPESNDSPSPPLEDIDEIIASLEQANNRATAALAAWMEQAA